MILKKSSFSRFLNKSRCCNWLILLYVFWFGYRHNDWQKPDRIIQNDICSYYLYLPAVFIYDDLTLKFADTLNPDARSKIWYNDSPTHVRVSKMSCGLAMMFCPFFLASHAYAISSPYPADGYSLPYRFGLVMASICFLAIGLYYLRKILNQYFPELITILCCGFITVGTNLFYYATYEPSMSHVFNFAIITAFIYYSIRWNTQETLRLSLVLGFLIGLISLTRPTNVIIVLFLFFYGVTSFKSLVEKAKDWITKFKLLIPIAVVAFVVWIPQFLYWKETTGSYLYYSYVDENFFFNDPVILKGLFGFRKGWFIYTPIMAFAFAGIFFLRKQLPSFFVPTLLFILLNIYIILSWWCWWYGGSFGARAFIDCYGLMAVPLGAFLSYFWNKNKIIFSGITCVLFALLYLNRLQTLQYANGFLHWDSMTKEAYFKNFGVMRIVGNYEELLDAPDYAAAKKGIR